MWLFKISGMIIIFGACSLLGFYAASKTEKRAKKLALLSRSLSSLAERIRTDGGEMNRLLKLCFKQELLTENDGAPAPDKSGLKPEDISVLEEFFENLGRGDVTAEYNRTSGFARLIESRYQEVKEESLSLCRLYKRLGCLIGIFICILLL